jgi:OmcA/MtrC family decaheme c-type cytochrome
MFSMIRGLLLLTTAVAVITPGQVYKPAVPGTLLPGHAYTSNQTEFYMTPDEVGYIRPGYKITVENVVIAADGKIEATVNFKDDKNQPLDRLGMVTPGTLGCSFILGWYDGSARQYTTYTTRKATSPITGVTTYQSSADSGGTWTDLELGRAKYTFKTTMPAGYDGSKTHTLAAYGARNLTDIIGKQYYANTEYDFRPDGGAVTETWNAFVEATCNACHTDLGMHGGSRKHIKNCVTCHQPQTMDPDTGNTVDMKVMIHKIHMGADLPSVKAGTPYIIIGHNQSVIDFSEVVLPQDIRNCTTCHKASSPEGDIWLTRPTRAACGSCHDDVDFAAGVNHPIPQVDDSACASCHAPEGESEFDVSIKGAHTIPTKSAQLKGLHSEILSVTGVVPGGMPVVTFRITENDGTVVAPSALNRCRIIWGGPTTDYTWQLREEAIAAPMDGDKAVLTFATAVPADATGTIGFSIDAYRNVTIDNHTEEGLSVRECAPNPLYYAEVGGARAVAPRRAVVATSKCNVCHDRIAFHGGQRMETQECVICHKPNATGDRSDEDATQINYGFKWMIHRIHTGEELREPWILGGESFSDFAFMGDRRACEMCHLSGTYGIPLPEGVLPTPDEGEFYTPILPTAAACLSCHSSMEAAAHAYTATAPFGESCETCHGADADFAVAKVHAR